MWGKWRRSTVPIKVKIFLIRITKNSPLINLYVCVIQFHPCSQVLKLGPLDLHIQAQPSVQPRHSLSKSVVCPRHGVNVTRSKPKRTATRLSIICFDVWSAKMNILIFILIRQFKMYYSHRLIQYRNVRKGQSYIKNIDQNVYKLNILHSYAQYPEANLHPGAIEISPPRK